MAQVSSQEFIASDGYRLFVYKWSPESLSKCKRIVHIAHGMAEHGGRYNRIAERLVSDGCVVYANDHRGHAKTAGLCDVPLGHVGYKSDAKINGVHDSFSCIIHDTYELLKMERKEHPDLPIFLFGHSMGSVIAQYVAGEWGYMLSGIILSAPPARPNRIMSMIYSILWKFLVWYHECTGYSNKIHSLTFDKFNKKFAPNRTVCDWISSDEAEVNKYIWDAHCGEKMTVGFWADFLSHICKSIPQYGFPERLPIFIFAGEMDPCHEKQLAIEQLGRMYADAGHASELIHVKIYPGGRHEMLNEIKILRNEVMNDIAFWIGSNAYVPSAVIDISNKDISKGESTRLLRKR